jgi:hypothetical protein
MPIEPEDIVTWPRLENHCTTVHEPLSINVKEIREETVYVRRLLMGLLVSMVVTFAGVAATLTATIIINKQVAENRPRAYYENKYYKPAAVVRVDRDTTINDGQ